MNDELETLLANVSRREPASADALARLPVELGIPLPDDYAAFMKASNGGEGEVGSAWIEIWPVERVGDDPDASPHYQGVVLFAGNGANTIYGFDRFRDGEIVEGDWIGLSRDELIRHGKTLTELLRNISG